jgi:hypothetical protein
MTMPRGRLRSTFVALDRSHGRFDILAVTDPPPSGDLPMPGFRVRRSPWLLRPLVRDNARLRPGPLRSSSTPVGWRSRCAHETPGLIALSFNPCGGPFGLRRIAPATTPSADFRLAVGTPRGGPSPRGQPRRLMVRTSRDFLPARPAKPASYPISVRRVAISLRASFRPRLAATPLRFTRASPPSDFHTQDAGHARHTECEAPPSAARGVREP